MAPASTPRPAPATAARHRFPPRRLVLRAPALRLPLAVVLATVGIVGTASANGPRKVLAEHAFAGPAETAAWREWSPRSEIAPQFTFDRTGGRNGTGALQITGRKAADFGAWRREIEGIHPGNTYRFAAWYRATGLVNERRSVIARLQWLDAAGQPVRVAIRPPEFALDSTREGDWVRVERTFTAPETAARLDVQLSLAFAAGGSVWWDGATVEEIAPPRGRVVRVMTVHHRPSRSPSAAANVEEFCAIIHRAADQKPDIICLPEGMTVVGTGRSYVDVSEPIPGPTTERLGAVARELGTYIVAGIYERDAPAVYNTAVLIDRQGRVAGRYRKAHLPWEEWERGIMPGDDYPVFTTDFGTIGLMVCWDVQFPEPWRAIARQGAELVLLPIWGGSETLMRARALENHTYVVSSGYNLKSCIVTPDGEILAEASTTSPAVTAEVHLDRKIYQPWIGDMSTRTWKEWRPELTWEKPAESALPTAAF
jgi:predicted amidohydrolase